MGSVLPQYHCFLKLLTKSFLNVLCEKPVILVELLLELRIVVIQDSEDGERSVCKKCTGKIANGYRNVYGVTGGIGWWYGTQQGSGKCSMNSFENTRRGSIPVLGLLSSTGVTPKVKQQKKHLL